MSESQEYWEARKARELYEELVAVEELAEMFRRIYMRASNEIQQEAIKIVRRFQLEHHLSQKEAERLLSTILDARDIDALIAALKRDPRNEELVAALESQAYAARLKRLQELQALVDALALQLIREIEPDAIEMLEEIGRAMYYREIFAMQQRAGVGFSFSPLDPERIKKILATPWLGSSFSERLWGNTKALAEAVKEEILISVLTGKSQHRMAQEIEKKFSAGANASRRLIRTEANYVANQLQIESYKATGVQKYIYVAILDLRTSEICRRLDKKEFPVAEAQAGKNLPPMHPWCRSTTIAWMPRELLHKLEQSAIDPKTGETITIPGDMTYGEWYDKYGPTKGLAASKGSTDVPEHDPPVLLETIDFTNKDEVISTLEKYEKEIADSPIENAIVICEDGSVYQCFGELNNVWPDIDLGDKLYGAYVTHNHPEGSTTEHTFGVGDINLFHKYGIRTLRGVETKCGYQVSREDLDTSPPIPVTQLDEMTARSETLRNRLVQEGLGYKWWRYE